MQNVITRVNSPADTEFAGRNFLDGTLPFSTTVLNPSFIAGNSVLNGINPAPNQTTGGEGPITGQEVQFDVDFVVPFNLIPNHYFFVPTVQLSSGEFFWLSAPRPIVAPGTPFAPDLQSWMRNELLDPDWSRIRVGREHSGSRRRRLRHGSSGRRPWPRLEDRGRKPEQ
jgi:hypothetical protein